MKEFVNFTWILLLKILLIIVFFFSLTENVASQIKQDDSLRYFRINNLLKENINKGNFNENIKLLKSELCDTKYHKSLKPMIYNDIAANYGMGGKIDSAKYYTELSINFCEENKIKSKEYYKALYNKSNILILNKKSDEALRINYTLLNYFKTSNHDLYLNTLINIGNILLDLRSFEESYDYLKLAEREAYDCKNYNALYRVYHNIAQLEYYKNLRTVNEKCISFAELSLETAFKTNRQYIVIDAKSNLGTYYWKIGKFSKAIELLISADSFYTQKNINNISVLTSLSRAYFMAGEIEKSRLYFEKIKPDDNLLNNIENKILGMSLENKSDTYRDFVLYKSLLDSNVIEETKLQVRALNKKFKLLEKENEIKRLNEINLLNKTKSQNLEVEFFKQSIENDKLSKEKMVVENELKDKAIIEISNKLEITTLNAVKKLSDLKLQEQKKVAFGSIFGFVIISILSIFIYLQSQNRKETNLKLEKQKDQIQLLHQELNHRVKNNLSFMTSLIEMQGRRTQNVEAREILQETENRLGALSLVHSNLFKNDSATTVNLAYYLEELVSQLEKICTIPDKDLKCNCDFTDHYVNAEDAMRLGLIVNELVTNSVKHAFQNVDEPLINISTSIDKDGKLVLEYRDNGPGTTQVTNNVVNEKNDHFGTKLIALLREQMKNRYTVNWGSSI